MCVERSRAGSGWAWWAGVGGVGYDGAA
jgi:hypothetical protein